MKQRLYFANDCSAYHGGSWAVAEVIKAEARADGWKIVPERTRTTIDEAAVLSCQGVLVNGEGTLHHDKPRARHLMELLRFAQQKGLKSALVNTSWSEMGTEHDDTLRSLDVLVAREPTSAARIGARIGEVPPVFLDLSIQHPISRARAGRRNGMVVTDFYSSEFDAFVDIKGGPISRESFLDMRRIGWRRTLAQVSRAEVLVTGRFHGLLAALATRTPFVAWPGNTDKIEAVLSWLGAEECLARSPQDLVALAGSWRERADVYESVFDRVAQAERWRLNLAGPRNSG